MPFWDTYLDPLEGSERSSDPHSILTNQLILSYLQKLGNVGIVAVPGKGMQGRKWWSVNINYKVKKCCSPHCSLNEGSMLGFFRIICHLLNLSFRQTFSKMT